MKLYGITGSRALRSIWALEEVGTDYDDGTPWVSAPATARDADPEKP